MTPVRKLEVWSIDDSPVDRALAEEAFAEHQTDCTMKTLASGINALAALHSPSALLPDVILLDLNMSGMDGLEVLKKLKAQQRVQYIPVIMLTTSQAGRDIQRAH